MIKLVSSTTAGRSGKSRSRLRGLIVAAATVSLLLSGCAAGNGSGSAPKDVTLNYSMWDAPQLPALKSMVAAFEKQNPHIKVKISVTPWDSYWTKLQTTATSGSAPDVFWMNTPNLPKYANGGVLMPLDSKIKADGVDMTQYAASSVKSATWNGKVYGMPKDVDALALWYNKKLFTDAGVALPTDTWTWADMVAAAQKLTNPSKKIFGIPALIGDQLGYYNTIPQSGGYVVSPDGKTSGYDQPATIAGVQALVDLIQKYHVSPTLQQMTDTDPTNMFESGKVAMTFAGSWIIPAFGAVPYLKANAGVTLMPLISQRGGVSNSLANVVYSKTKYPEQAWKFVKFLGSSDAATIEAKSGVIPAYKSAQATWAAAVPSQFNPQAYIDTVAVATPFPRSLNTSVWETFATTEFTKAWSGTESVETAAKNVAAEMNTALAAEK
jgi:multiple sugar transport system substrate-binding protein